MSDLHVEAEKAARVSVRRRYIVQGAISLVVACLSVASTLSIQGLTNAQGDRDSNAAIAQTYSAQLQSEGIKPAVNPDKIKGDPGPAGPAGPAGSTGPAVSAADVARAVVAFCRGGRCKGAPGQTGPAVTQEQVATAVRSYCDANGRCRGRSGAAGAPGATGSAGADGNDGNDGATGAQGPPPTDKQISEAVVAFCSGGACQGPAGAQGEQGPQGIPGPACPDGTTAQTRSVVTTSAPLGEPAVLCIPGTP